MEKRRITKEELSKTVCWDLSEFDDNHLFDYEKDENGNYSIYLGDEGFTFGIDEEEQSKINNLFS